MLAVKEFMFILNVNSLIIYITFFSIKNFRLNIIYKYIPVDVFI